jgi:hypothetical protein
VTESWNRLVREGLVVGSERNVKLPFRNMCKKYGISYIEYLQSAWIANEGTLTTEEFRVGNGDLPEAFFNKKVLRQ